MTKDPTADIRDARGKFKKGFSGNPTGTHRKPEAAEEPSGVRLDSWLGAFSGIGDENRDKRQNHTPVLTCVSYQQAVDLWRTSDIAAKAVEHLGKECFRNGYEWQFANNDTTDAEEIQQDLEDDFEELEIDDAVEWAIAVSRGIGGSAILLGIDDNQKMHMPVKEGTHPGLDWVKVLEPIELTVWSYYDDPSKPKYGQPKEFLLSNFYHEHGLRAPSARTNRDPLGHIIHETRLDVYQGVRVSEYQQYRSNELDEFWGDSIFVRLFEILRDFDISWAAAGILSQDFSVQTLSMENLMSLVAKHPDKVRARARALNLSRSVAGVQLIDTKEKMERHSTNISNFPELLDRISARTSAGIGIPLSLWMNNGTKGIGNTDDPVVRFYYDGIASEQRRKVRRRLKKYASMVMRRKHTYKIPKRYNPKFLPLYSVTEKDAAEIKLNLARADEIYVKYGVMSPDEIRRTRFFGGFSQETALPEGKKAPGFVAMQPKGVGGAGVPGATPGAATPNAHAVTGYARRNPNATVTPKRADEDGPGDRLMFAGFPVVIESPRGSTRSWTDSDGTKGSTRMRYDYGFIEGAMGADGDSVDVYLGPSESAAWVYVVHQMKKSTDFAEYDEDKVMLGFSSADHARDAYLHQYDDDRFFGGMSMMTVEDFRRRLRFTPTKVTNAE